ncbi:release factor glutamine methyltransferase [Metamycoplasma subdolum]|uniref:peptide chain release factor N(5)-glutamine methyltransferase n=1 Tax=Metamycoplasma subdolum TaxID=92407 RepID=A0A3L9ZYD7_9BACT|nr:peptide chain release factor N(5)-glutamine methyltransferase [Metamycoplasma subdolum]RMA77460.1 release factor glutamine methyltransferase [Metamycoplasma subdolum]WPB50311.1 peptide chain release factor N(5)-glutamine methyltransferase [Metamycoplasma subdolum]
MIEKEVLLREKRRYDLEPYITRKELRQLKRDVPVQKIIGFQVMQNVYLDLRYNVLIPRYETEEVILVAYHFIDEGSRVLDLGCGSGFIGLAIRKNKRAIVEMVDSANAAIKQSILNAKYNELDVKIYKSNWFSNVEGKFNVIISNPPYLDKNKEYPVSLKYEPKRALFGKQSAISEYEKILKNAKNYLYDEGILIFEIDFNSAKYIKDNYPNATILNDINGKERIAILQKEDL